MFILRKSPNCGTGGNFYLSAPPAFVCQIPEIPVAYELCLIADTVVYGRRLLENYA